VAHVHAAHKAARLALEVDALLLDLDHGLGVAAVVALHILLDEGLQQLAQLLGVVGAVHDGGARALVVVGLGAQLAAKELQDIWGGSRWTRYAGEIRPTTGAVQVRMLGASKRTDSWLLAERMTVACHCSCC
jgi:hypothetical protein